MLGHARARGSGAYNPRPEAEHRSRLRALTFCVQRGPDRHALHGDVQYWPVGCKSRWATKLLLVTPLRPAGSPRNRCQAILTSAAVMYKALSFVQRSGLNTESNGHSERPDGIDSACNTFYDFFQTCYDLVD